MSYKAIITVNDARLHDVVMPDLQVDKRCSVTSKKKDSETVFEIVAEDAVALRASMNTLAKAFIIFEKTGKIK